MLDNPFIAGTVAVVFTGAIMASAYKVPKIIWRFVRNRLVLTVDIDDVDPCFRWVKAYIASIAKARWLMAYSMPSSDSPDARMWEPKDKPILYLAPKGLSWFRFQGRLIVAWLEKTPLQHNSGYRETISLQFWKRSKTDVDIIKSLVEESRQFVMNQGGKRVEVWLPNGSDWSVSERKLPRPQSSLVLADDIVQRVIDDAKRFLANREWYRQMGVPWRRSYLLHGPPGNGKSSLVHVLASSIWAHINVASLSHFQNDQEMISCMSKVPPGNILLIEDIDSAFVGREQKAGTKISFAALLNCLDGIVSQDGRIVIMSTNHVDALDPALVRPGRADMRILLNNATVTQAAEMYKRFFADATEAQANSFGIENDGQSMAKIQEQLLRLYSEDETVEQTKENSSSLQTV